MIRSSKKNYLPVYLWIGMLLLTVQCDTTLEPLDKENGSFSVRARVDMDNDIHFFRVNDLKKTLYQETVPIIDGKVTLENLTAGSIIILPDSMVNFDGVFTHNFFTEDMVYGHAYMLTVERLSSDNLVQGTWTNPRRAEIEIDGLPADRTALGCHDPITITYKPVLNTSEIDLRIFAGTRRYYKPIFEKNGNESVSATFSLLDITKIAFGNLLKDCSILEERNLLSLHLIHYGPDYFEDNLVGGISDSTTIATFGALYKEKTILQPYSDSNED